jgi:hypothetical protein
VAASVAQRLKSPHDLAAASRIGSSSDVDDVGVAVAFEDRLCLSSQLSRQICVTKQVSRLASRLYPQTGAVVGYARCALPTGGEDAPVRRCSARIRSRGAEARRLSLPILWARRFDDRGRFSGWRAQRRGNRHWHQHRPNPTGTRRRPHEAEVTHPRVAPEYSVSRVEKTAWDPMRRSHLCPCKRPANAECLRTPRPTLWFVIHDSGDALPEHAVEHLETQIHIRARAGAGHTA